MSMGRGDSSIRTPIKLEHISRVKMGETREYEDSGGNPRDHERSEGSRGFTMRIRVFTRRLHFYTGNKFLVRVLSSRVTFFKFQISKLCRNFNIEVTAPSHTS